jgi:DNA-directed RNA polymerase specialized sigma24 family protein
MTATETRVINCLTKDEAQHFSFLYASAFPAVARFISRHRGTFQDAKDIFQDALVIFYEKTKDGGAPVKVSPESYIFGIAKHLWIKKYNRGQAEVRLDEFEKFITIPNDYYQPVASDKLLHFLNQAGEKCLALLRAFYYTRVSVRDITNLFGYRNEHTASVQKFKCLEKIRDNIKSKALRYEDFIE